MNKKALLFLFSFLSVLAYSQDYKWQAKLDSVKKDGFYKIQLSPAIISKLDYSLGDLRIRDNHGKDVPYILKTESPVTDSNLFREYTISSIDNSRKKTTVLIENPTKKKIDNIELIIKNADITKSLRLSGSDDKKQWYIVKDNYFISDVYNNHSTSTVKILDFPLSDYQYFKIEMSDSASPSIKILKAGYYDTYIAEARYTEVQNAKISQTGSAETKETYVKIAFPDSQLVDKICFMVEGPHYYYRNCYLGLINETTFKNGKTEKSFNQLGEPFTLSSNGSNTVYTSGFRGKILYLRIANQDNPPLKITTVKAFQVNHYLIGYLQKNQLYTLVFGNDKALIPDYDLSHFKDSISFAGNISFSTITQIKKENTQQANAPTSLFANKTVMWIALGIVLLLLAGMSFKMIKDIGNQ